MNPLPPQVQSIQARDPQARAPQARGLLFLDRDGTIVEDVGYPSTPDELRLLPGAGSAIAALNAAGWIVIVITNQAGVAHGCITLQFADQGQVLLQTLLRPHQAHIDGYHHCPHHPQGRLPTYRRTCPARKPGTALLEKAARTWNLPLDARAVFIGDKRSDIDCGAAYGIRPILVRSGQGRQSERTLTENPAAQAAFHRRHGLIFDDLQHAAHFLRQEPPS